MTARKVPPVAKKTRKVRSADEPPVPQGKGVTIVTRQVRADGNRQR